MRVQGKKLDSEISSHFNRSRDTNVLPTPEPSSQRDPADEPPPSSPFPDRYGHDKAIESEEDDDEIVLPSSKRRRLESIHINSSQPTPTRKSARLNSTYATSSSPVTPGANHRPEDDITQNHLSDIASAESSADDEDFLLSKPLPTRRRKTMVEDDPFVAHDDAIHRSTSSSRHKAKPFREADFVVDDDEIEYISSDPDVQPTRKRKSATKKSRRSQQEQDELEDDLANLQSSDVEDAASRARTRGGPITTQKNKDREHLNVLKRRRSIQRRSHTVIVDEEEEEIEEHYDGRDGVDLDKIGARPRISAARDRYDDKNEDVRPEDTEAEEPRTYDLELSEEDFVIDDDDELDETRIDRPHPDMPLAFTSFATRKPKDLFVYAIEWLVKNKIAPAFSRSDELYTLAWNKLNDQIKAQAGSRLISSAWNQDFKNTILARPHMKVMHIDEGEDEAFMDCDACNRTNHPARYQFQFEGCAYNKETLEPIDDSDDEKGGDNDDTESYDQAGHVLPSHATLFYLGSHCAANAEMGHKLTHWRYHLNSSLLDYLEEQGVLSAESILARERSNKKKREKEAENIVDHMEATGVVGGMWQGLQDDLEDARFGMEDHYTKAGRSKTRVGKVRIDRGGGLIEQWGENDRRTTIIASDSDDD